MSRRRKFKFPKTTVERLSHYFRALEELVRMGTDTVSSKSLGDQLNIKSSQIRKDLSYFGYFGKRGMGYDVKYLLKELKYILGLDRQWNVIVIGAGHLGKAISHYTGFENRGFIVTALFENDSSKVGSEVYGAPVFHTSDLEDYIENHDVHIAILAVPESAAQKAADLLTANGVKAILNFAPATINTPDDVRCLNVDLTTKLEALAYFMSYKVYPGSGRRKKYKFPKTTVERLSYYYRELEELSRGSVDTVSSDALGDKLNIKSSQIRKDLSYFGYFGKRGMGYDVKYLLKELKYILGLDRQWNVIVAGAGHLGKAITHYPGFQKRGFVINSIFDTDPEKIGTDIYGISVRDARDLEEYIDSHDVDIGILALPYSAAQSTADRMVSRGVKAILNFAPVTIQTPDDVRCLNVDLTTKLEALAYYMSFPAT